MNTRKSGITKRIIDSKTLVFAPNFKQMKYLWLILLSASLYSCSESTGGDTAIKGSIAEENNQKLYIHSSLFYDSVMTDQDGSFEYEMTINEPIFVRITNADKRKAAILLMEKGEEAILTITDPLEWQNNYTITGSKGSSKLIELNNHYTKSLSEMENIRMKYNEDMKEITPGSDEHKTISDKSGVVYDSIVTAERNFLISFIKENINSPVAISALYQTFDYRTGKPIILMEPDGFEYFKMADSALWSLYPEAQDIKNFHQSVAQIKEDIAKQEAAEAQAQANQLNIGDEAPEILLPNPGNEKVSLHSLRGKYILLDFWASWCAPCRLESSALVKAYNDFNEKGFDIYQVSLDKTKKAWVDAIQKDGLYWKNHVSDLKFWNSEAAKQYGIQAIPANYLLDKNGIVIAKNLKGEDLYKELEKLF